MTKKIFGLLLVASLVVIIIVTMVRNNLDRESSIDNEQLGTDMIGIAADEGLQRGKMAPDFTLTTLDGETVKLSDFQGKKVIVNFWASWCPPCKAEMPHMQRYYQEFAQDEQVEILAINLTSGDKVEKVEKFVRDYELTFPIPLDKDGKVGKTYEVLTIPTSYIIDTKGLIQHKIVGPMDEKMMKDFIFQIE